MLEFDIKFNYIFIKLKYITVFNLVLKIEMRN